MDFFKRKKKEPTPEQLQATVPPEVAAPPANAPLVVEQPIRYPIEVGEHFPWKGFMFRVAEVNDHGFSAIVAGVTKARKAQLEAKRKELALKK